jgi:hypothetical protein
MSNISIPSALDPHGDRVPIEEAIRGKLDYYRCPECREFVNPRKGPKRQYFAHRQGVLDDTDCSLSSDADVREMVDELRRSDVEEGEKQRSIRIHLGERYEGHLECFGVIPSLEWGHLPSGASVGTLLEDVQIETEGVETPPVPQNFHPSEAETNFRLDPDAGEYRVSITGPDELDAIVGEWTADGLADGDLFAGDQSRARRHESNRQVKEGEWVYLVLDYTPPGLPDVVEETTIGDQGVLAFPARESTASLLEDYADGITTDDYGFDADVILPADAHPTIEAPLSGAANETTLIGVTPADDIDPQFEVVAIPKEAGDVIELDPTGPGNPRLWSTRLPEEGSRRISIHQRNSERHRMIHLHAAPDQTRTQTHREIGPIGIQVHPVEGDSVMLSPLQERRSFTVSADRQPTALPPSLAYEGPEGLEIGIQARFIKTAQLGPTVTRSTTTFDDWLPELVHWVNQGCERVQFRFDGLGAVTLQFPQPELAADLAETGQDSQGGGGRP